MRGFLWVGIGFLLGYMAFGARQEKIDSFALGRASYVLMYKSETSALLQELNYCKQRNIAAESQFYQIREFAQRCVQANQELAKVRSRAAAAVPAKPAPPKP